MFLKLIEDFSKKITDNFAYHLNVRTGDLDTVNILNDMKYYHYCLNQYCSYFLQSISNDIVNKYWLKKICIKIIFQKY